MKKLLAIIVMGLLWGNVGFAQIITLNKCRDLGDKKMNPAEEKNYYTIDLKNKKLTNVIIYTDEYYFLWQKSAEKYPALKDTFLGEKTIVADYTIYYDDENIVKAKHSGLYKDGIRFAAEYEVHLKNFKIYATSILTNDFKPSVNKNVKTQLQCDLKK